jgi:VanZ family protein
VVVGELSRLVAGFGRVLTKLWGYRRWAYAAYVLYGVLAIPARTGFHLLTPACDLRLTSQNFAASMTKVPHIVLFAFFFLLTVAQFERVDRKTVAWSFFATVGLGLLIELEEGATRTGYCRVTDVIPDAWGALIAMVPLMAALMTYRLWVSRSGPTISN